MKSLSVEEIYDAAADDGAFQAISRSLAETLGGRSALIHWIHRDGETDILSHSGYFTDEQLGRYATEYALIDPWVVATSSPAAANRALDLETFVSTEQLVRSELYAGFLNGIGDDTARCIGVRLNSDWGSGFISVQRGLGQERFSAENLQELRRLFPHVRRMLAIRGRMAAADHQSTFGKATLDALAQPVFLVTAAMRVQAFNAASDKLLNGGGPLKLQGGTLSCSQHRCDLALRKAVSTALMNGGEAAAVAIGSAGKRLNLSIMPTAGFTGARLALVIAETAPGADRSRSGRLQALYGLSETEAAIALLLADGLSPADIADRRRVSIATVRVQIKHVAAKMGSTRQSDIVRMVSALPVFATPMRRR